MFLLGLFNQSFFFSLLKVLAVVYILVEQDIINI